METIEFFAIISIAIMCWLFCTSCSFVGMCDENDTIFDQLGKLILAILFGWIITPIYFGAKLSDF